MNNSIEFSLHWKKFGFGKEKRNYFYALTKAECFHFRQLFLSYRQCIALPRGHVYQRVCEISSLYPKQIDAIEAILNKTACTPAYLQNIESQ